MSLTRLDNLYSSKTGKYLYVSPDDFNATDTLDNRGNSPNRPFKSIQRAFLEVSRFSYQPGANNDRFDQFSIMLMPGDHYIDNRPGLVNYSVGTTSSVLNRYADAGNLISANKLFLAYEAYALMLQNNPGFQTPTGQVVDCIDDVVNVIDAIVYNIKFGGNNEVFDAAIVYQNNPDLIANELSESLEVYGNLNTLINLVITNAPITSVQGTPGSTLSDLQISSAYTQIFDPTISTGPSNFETGGAVVPYGQAETCADVQSTVNTLFSVLVDGINEQLDISDRNEPETLGEIPIFNFDQNTGQWDDNSIVDLSNPNNIYWKFNASTGGAIVPRGCSLVGYDLRRTIVRPLYVPDPADSNQARTSIFNLTGGCYLWQFTIKDGDLSENSPLYDPTDAVGKVYYQKGNISSLAVPDYSHHKICIMEYAENFELDAYYEKVAIAFSKYQPTIDDEGEFSALVQENRIVGPLSDTRSIEKIQPIDTNLGQPNQKLVLKVTTKIDHGYFKDQFVAILNTGLDEETNGTFKIASIDPTDPKIFTYEIPGKVAAGLGLVNNQQYRVGSGLSNNAVTQAEIDSVESASPYVFNCSIRSTWGMCGMWANGAKSTGFRSMVVAQYTGVSLQKDDRAFIRYDEFTNTWNQASLTDAFATVPYHTKGDAYWKDDWRNFHIRASEDAFIQCVSVFAVGFFDHFLMESGGDMSITNSNSNFGNTSLHSIGHKGYAFNQDKGGYITDIIPPQELNGGYASNPNDPSINSTRIPYYPIDIVTSNDTNNKTRIYLGSDSVYDPARRPAATLNGYRIGARPDERLFVKLEPRENSTDTIFSSTITPNSIETYQVGVDFLNPTGISINQKAQDAANLINANKEFIQDEVYGYITKKYDTLLTNENITISTCRRDIGYYVDAIVQDLRLGGNINSIQAAEAYFVGGQLTYIQNEQLETQDALRYTRNLCIAAMRNWDYFLTGCSCSTQTLPTDLRDIINVPSTEGLVVGMKVTSYSAINPSNNTEPSGAPTNVIPPDTYIVEIIDDTTIRIGEKGQWIFGDESYDPSPADKHVTQTVNDLYLLFTMRDEQIVTSQDNIFAVRDGIFSLQRTVYDDTVVQDIANISSGETECSDIASIISGLVVDIITILASPFGEDGVERIEPETDFSALSKRATLFRVTGNNPHGMETGTPVRLVPKAAPGQNPDPRLIRLPKGFDTNTKYYVIAPGRNTSPENYSNTTAFDGTDQTVFLLASTPENAKAGNYIYSPETDAIDPGIVIEVNNYIIGDTYDLHSYVAKVSSGDVETNLAHHFDVPAIGVLPQKVFFRQIDNDTPLPNQTILSGQNFVTQAIDKQEEYFVRYITNNKFRIYRTFIDAVNDVNNVILLESILNGEFIVYSNKRFSPLRFDPKPISNGVTTSNTGQWYIQVKDNSSNPTDILGRITQSQDSTYFGSSPAETRSADTYFERINDTRIKEDRVYKLRYVIPKYLQTVRDPLNGFVLKVRTDSKRRLRPQRIVLKPVNGNYQQTTSDQWTFDSIASFINDGPFDETGNFVNTQELLGRSTEKYQENGVIPNYDPYINPKIIETNSTKTSFSIQSAKIIDQEVEVGSNYKYLEIIAFDHTLENQALKNERLTVVEVDSPDGQPFIFNNLINESSNIIRWSGGSSGEGYLHAYLKTSDLSLTPKSTNGAKYYLVIKNITNGEIKYNKFTPTVFFQGGDSLQNSLSRANLLAKPDSIGSLDGGSKSSKEDYLYSFKGSNVYSLVPGDVITDDSGKDFYIDTVEDVGELEDTFYIFDIQEIKERIPGQQDGIYYLICLKGNVSPFPTGPGVGNNFKNFKFSQPISYLYPQDYKNDPLWYQQIDAEFNDPPATNSAADNYTHGLVTVNDARYSETKEVINFLIDNPALSEYDYVNDVQNGNDARIRAQVGNAVAGAEDRKIPIKGTSRYPTDAKLYVELRRPSIARSGNHTFEYLGFGPGNYSTGFPLRQEVILTDAQDFYAQSKREDGGIVFYTGLNSNGDLYIGNKKVNAITGEETFLESAQLIESEDADDDVGDTLVTTFETPVTFNNKITVNGPSSFTQPVTIQVDPDQAIYPTVSLRIQSLVDEQDLGEDATLDRSSFTRRADGDITLSKNRINSAIYGINPRGNTNFPGQKYSIRTHVALVDNVTQPSNITPNQNANIYNSTSTTRVSSNRLFADQVVYYGNSANTPQPGDILLKGVQVDFSGSLGWTYANRFVEIPSTAILTVATPKIDQIGQIGIGLGVGTGIDELNLVRFVWSTINGAPITNETLRQTYGLTPQSLVRVSGITGDLADDANGIFEIYQDTYNTSNQYLDVVVGRFINDYDVVTPFSSFPEAELFISNSQWKEVGVIGAEAIRTETSVLGDFKLGINTVSRTSHGAYVNSFVDESTVPRANLDLVGNAFISGTTDARDALGVTFSLYKDQPNAALRTKRYVENALLVGGEEDSPNDLASFRVSTGHGTQIEREVKDGRVGINLTNDQLNGSADSSIYNRAFSVYGGATISGNVRFERNLELNGAAQNEYNGTYGTASLTSRATTFNFINTASNNNVVTLNMGGQVTTANLFHNATGDQTVNIGTSSLSTVFNLHTASQNSTINLGIVGNVAGYESVISVGGAIETPNASQFLIRNYRTILAGKMVLRGGASDTGKLGLIEGEGIDEVSMFPEGVTKFSIGPRATIFDIGATAGKTTINNSLIVKGTALIKSDVVLEGGLRNSSITVERNIFGTLRISKLSRTSNVATIKLIAPQTVLSTGQKIEVFTPFDAFNTAAPEDVTVVDSTTLTYPNVGQDLVEFDATGTIRTLGATSIPFGNQQPTGDEIDNLNVDFYQRVENIAPIREITTISGTTKLNISFNYLSENDPIKFISLGNIIGSIDGNSIDQITTYYVKTADNAGITVTDQPSGTSTALFNYVDPSQQNAGGAEIALSLTKIDTQGDVPWGGDEFENEDGSYRLYVNNPVGLSNGQYFLINQEVVFAVSEPSAVRPYYIDVERGADGSPIIAHPDDTQIFLLGKTENATYITPNPISENGVVINVGEFSATVSQNDILKLNGGTSNEEWVRVIDTGVDNAQKLIVNNGDFGDILNPKDPLEVFKVNSVNGNTRVIGDLQIGYDIGSNTIPDNDFLNSQSAADTFGLDSSIATGNTIGTTGGGNLRVHNSIELSGNSAWDPAVPSTYPARQYFLITNGQFPRFFVESKTGDTTLYGSGSLRIFKDEFYNTGGWDKAKVDQSTKLRFEVQGSTGNTKIAGTLRAGNDFTVGTLFDSENAETGVNPFTTRFSVDAETGSTILGRPGNTGVGATLNLYGLYTNSPSDDAVFSVSNLGINNGIQFNINQDGSIDAFGQSKFFNVNGGTKTVFISSQGNTDSTAEELDSNVTYIVRPTSDLILKLPNTAITGDVVRIVDVGGVLNFGVNLVVRSDTNIQNQFGGSTLGGLSSPFAGGELVVNTPNAAFGLIYVGQTDSNGVNIPGANQGWFLLEI